MISKVLNNAIPLCFLNDSRLVCYKRGRIVVLRDCKEDVSIPISISMNERLFGWSCKATRLLRFGVRSSIAVNSNHIIISIGNYLYEINLSTGEVSKGWFCGEGIRPLIMSNIMDIRGFEDGVYFGGYVHNHGMESVHIYHRKGVDDWETAYTFPKGTINHIHNVVADPFRQCLWVFTGDFDDAAAIWKVIDGFKTVERVRCGNQCWRGSMVFVMEEGLLYATDTPRADNYLYLLNLETMDLREVIPLPGSCIYGCQWKNNYVLATSVEGEGGKMGFFEKWLGRKRGKGIKDEYVHLFSGNIKDGFREIYKEKKDWLPFTLFQFGVFKFPIGVNKSEKLYFQPVATSKNDLCLMAIHD